jgi:hypothetical protein
MFAIHHRLDNLGLLINYNTVHWHGLVAVQSDLLSSFSKLKALEAATAEID